MSHQGQTVLLPPGEGEFFRIIGGGVRVLVDGQQSAGSCFVFEVPVEPGEGPPLHRHAREDEMFFVLAGTFRIRVDDREVVVSAGGFVFAPRGTIHAFRNVGSEQGRLLVACVPAGLEEAFRQIKLPDASPGASPPSMERVGKILEEFGISFHGPPLQA